MMMTGADKSLRPPPLFSATHSSPHGAAPPSRHTVRSRPRRRWHLARLALPLANRSVSLNHQPVRPALALWLKPSHDGLCLGCRECGRLRRSFNDFRRLLGSSREHGLDGLDSLLNLLVGHRLDDSRMFNFHIPRAQQCQQLAVNCRLVLAYFGNCRWSAMPKVSQQRRDELAVQLLAVTRADRTAGRVA